MQRSSQPLSPPDDFLASGALSFLLGGSTPIAQPSTPAAGEAAARKREPDTSEAAASSAKRLKEGRAQTYIVSCRDSKNDEIAIKTIVGQYEEKGENHGRQVFQKKTAHSASSTRVNILLYYWDEQGYGKYTGWWIGNKLGGTQVWAHAPGKDESPPSTGWKVPWDGAVHPHLQVMTKAEKEREELQLELQGFMEQVSSLKADAMGVWNTVNGARVQDKITVGRLSEAESTLAAYLINAEYLSGKVERFGEALKNPFSKELAKQYKKVKAAAQGLEAGLKAELNKVQNRRSTLELETLQREEQARDKGRLRKMILEVSSKLALFEKSVDVATEAVRQAHESAKAKEAADVGRVVKEEMEEEERKVQEAEAARQMKEEEAKAERGKAVEKPKIHGEASEDMSNPHAADADASATGEQTEPAAGNVKKEELETIEVKKETPDADMQAVQALSAVEGSKHNAEQAVGDSARKLKDLKDYIEECLVTSQNFQDAPRVDADRELKELHKKVVYKEAVLRPLELVRAEWEHERMTKEAASRLTLQSREMEDLTSRAMQAISAVDREAMPSSQVNAAFAAVEMVQQAHSVLQAEVQGLQPQIRQALATNMKLHIPGIIVTAQGALKKTQVQWRELQLFAKATDHLKEIRAKADHICSCLAEFETKRKAIDDAMAAGEEVDLLPEELDGLEASAQGLQQSIANTRVQCQMKSLEVRRFESDACRATLATFQKTQDELQALLPRIAAVKDGLRRQRGMLTVHDIDVKVRKVEEFARRAAELPEFLGSEAKAMEAPLEDVEAAFATLEELQQALVVAPAMRQYIANKQIEVKQARTGYEQSSAIVKCNTRLTTAQTQLESALKGCVITADTLAAKRVIAEWLNKCSACKERTQKMEEVRESVPACPTFPSRLDDLPDPPRLEIQLVPDRKLKELEQSINQARVSFKLLASQFGTMDWKSLGGPVLAEPVAKIRAEIDEVSDSIDRASRDLQDQKAAAAALPLLQEALKDYAEGRSKVRAVAEVVEAGEKGRELPVKAGLRTTPAAATTSLRRVKPLLNVKVFTLQKLSGEPARMAEKLATSLLADIDEMLAKMPALTKAYPKNPTSVVAESAGSNTAATAVSQAESSSAAVPAEESHLVLLPVKVKAADDSDD